MPTVLQWVLVGLVLAVAALQAVLALLPGRLRFALGRALAGRGPAWLLARLNRGAGCASCAGVAPAGQQERRRSESASGPG